LKKVKTIVSRTGGNEGLLKKTISSPTSENNISLRIKTRFARPAKRNVEEAYTHSMRDGENEVLRGIKISLIRIAENNFI
jgi:hypothetical protein